MLYLVWDENVGHGELFRDPAQARVLFWDLVDPDKDVRLLPIPEDLMLHPALAAVFARSEAVNDLHNTEN